MSKITDSPDSENNVERTPITGGLSDLFTEVERMGAQGYGNRNQMIWIYVKGHIEHSQRTTRLMSVAQSDGREKENPIGGH